MPYALLSCSFVTLLYCYCFLNKINGDGDGDIRVRIISKLSVWCWSEPGCLHLKKNCTLLDGHPLTIPTVFGGHRECVPDLLTEWPTNRLIDRQTATVAQLPLGRINNLKLKNYKCCEMVVRLPNPDRLKQPPPHGFHHSWSHDLLYRH